MTIERLDPSRIGGLSDADVEKFIESDFRIRSGLCPNGHGLMTEEPYGQSCPVCGFTCNIPAEKGDPQ